ncbi:hypothetical protein [Candidatus Enterococcus huntleyi]|uniref:hypothetical protein n=1 Tax=Candidatus Enterococcus huntleyi TaxID=1857217 RepID=UPI00192A2367|nr:hypothetical protein [Enterococcus sp. JM4C]
MKVKWYNKKRFYVPLALILGSNAFIVSFLGLTRKDKFNKKYYQSKDESLSE